MADVAVRAVQLGKIYRIGERQSYQTVRDVIAAAARSRLRRLSHRRHAAGGAQRSTDDEWIWALEDVSFELAEGEALGIIGRNGAGKSTLLKILSRITEPTKGHAVISGRVGALLEVGTGFHPELTGRENITLNGAILGMRRAEIDRKFDEIVGFAGLERFIDTPVKRYSTGMHARLAFAVAAHLEPDILIVDEVLAVGDAAFQKRCMGKMGDAARSGRTVLFVSHNMAAIESLCSRAIWLEGGRCAGDGAPSEVISRYLATSLSALNEHLWPEPGPAPGNDVVRMRRARVRPEQGTAEDPIFVTTPFVIEFEYWNLRAGAYLNLSLHIYNEQGVLIFNARPAEEAVWRGRPFPRGLFRDVCHVPGNLLNDGVHRIELLVVAESRHVIHRMDDVLVFEVRDVGENGEGSYEPWAGAVRPRLEWETEQLVPLDSMARSDG
ncbi:MAG: polysaccharide ABC transporter ATP-binding protein [Chloroflexota bacterium]|nr:polysaccharide ABC transporter ATP-binding protein [Chloroflexota bacterium]